jgi:hypothetical protein
MKLYFMPALMWQAFRKSFQDNLNVLGVADKERTMRQAKAKYKEIIARIPPFQKDDVLRINILSAAMFAAVYLSLPAGARVEQLEEYYRRSMNANAATMLVLKSTKNFSKAYQRRIAKDAEKSQRATNPYTWRYTYSAGETLDSFDAIFDKCGICALFKALGIEEITPALCAYDYEMAKYTNTIFTRQYTLASGGPVCDCHYRRRVTAAEQEKV